MQQPQQTQLPSDQITVSGSINLAYFAANCLALVTLPFIRFGFGAEGIGLHGLATLVILFSWGCLTESPLMLLFMGVWFIAVLAQRAVTLWDWARGVQVHSRYKGDPWLGGLFTRHEKVVRLFVEPAIVLGVGWITRYSVSLQLGQLLMVSGGAIFVLHVLEYWAEWVRVRTMVDARIEQQRLAALYRGHGLG